MAFNNEIEEVKAQLKVLEKKLALLEELEKTKSPVEEAFKDWWGQYPETGTWDGFDEKRWQGFQAGYEFAYQEKVSETAQERGERLHKDVERVVRESVKWCEEHPDWDLFDCLKPQTPEQVADGLKEAFREAVKQGVVSKANKPTDELIDEEDNDKNFKNTLDLIKEWGEKNKPPTLYQLIENWWSDIFCANSMDDMETCIDGLVDIIDKKFIPPSSERNTYDWERCLKRMREKLR